ncbi:hypothetical protein ACF0H5_004671 [Mactra antiquata]
MMSLAVIFTVSVSLLSIQSEATLEVRTVHITTAPTTGGCQYMGKVYHTGESWDHGCRYQCTCLDGTIDKYSCKDLCPTYLNVPNVCKMVTSNGDCCPHPDCSGTNITTIDFQSVNNSGNLGIQFCSYKGIQYAQNETWRQGCEWECTCTDAATGYYRCSSLCYSWSLPDVCHMEPAPAGKCCETPSCPVGYKIVYPAGYVAN